MVDNDAAVEFSKWWKKLLNNLRINIQPIRGLIGFWSRITPFWGIQNCIYFNRPIWTAHEGATPVER